MEADADQKKVPAEPASSGAKKKLTKGLLFALKLGASVGLIAFAVRDVDFDEAWRLATSLHPLAIVGVFFALVFKTLAGGLRWRGVIRTLGGHMRYARTLAIFMLGLFFNQTMPSTIGGDAVRIWRARVEGVDLGCATRSVLLERVGGFLVLLILIGVGSPFLWKWTGDAQAAITYAAVALGGFLAIGLMLLVGRISLAERHKVVRALLSVARDSRVLFLQAGPAAQVISLSLVIQGMQVMVVYSLARGVGVDLSLLQAFVLVPVVFLAVTLPISVAGWGVREAGLVTTLGLVGVPPEPAVVISVLFGLSLIAWGVICGGAWLLMRQPDEPKALRPPGEWPEDLGQARG